MQSFVLGGSVPPSLGGLRPSYPQEDCRLTEWCPRAVDHVQERPS
jgi:hypothetical protein